MPPPLSSKPTTTLIIITIIIFITILCSSPSSVSAEKQRNQQHRPFKKIYAFGDSFTDTGNTKSETGPTGFSHVSSPPYGSTFFHRPTNRYSDGRLVVDFLAQSLNLPFLKPYLGLKNGSSGGSDRGVNFAIAGSTAVDYGFFVKNNLSLDITPRSILTQLGWFEEFLGRKGRGEEVFGDALFWVGEIGVNDYAYILGSEVSGDTIRDLAIKNVKTFLQSLLKKGAKYMVVQGQPPTGCLTLAMYLAPTDDRDNLGCVKSANNNTHNYNTALQALLHDLRLQFPRSVIAYADYWSAYVTVLSSPTKYGFKNLFDACCGSGDEYNYSVFTTCGAPNVGACSNVSQYINWDGVHLTESMYKVVSEFLIRGEFSHPPFRYLLDRKTRQGR